MKEDGTTERCGIHFVHYLEDLRQGTGRSHCSEDIQVIRDSHPELPKVLEI